MRIMATRILQSDYLIIGITGSSCSGKTGLTRKLCRIYSQAIAIHQDDFYLDFDSVPKSKDVETIPLWDVPEALDANKLVQAIRNAATKKLHAPCQGQRSSPTCVSVSVTESSPHLIIVEGTMIASIRKLRDMLHALFFITLDYDTCQTRRNGRDYGMYKNPPGYFQHHVWPGYIRELDAVKTFLNNDTIYMLDGVEEPETLLSIVEERIDALKRTLLTETGLEPGQ